MIRLLSVILSAVYFVSINGLFNHLPNDKNVSWETNLFEPDVRNLGLSTLDTEEETDALLNNDHLEISTLLGRHRRQMPTYSKQLHHVGLFIAAHKYFGIDSRKTSDRSRHFYRSFPVPPLKNMHSKLDSSCKKSAIQCILAIHKVILSPGTSSLYPLLHHTVPPLNWPGFYPFRSWGEMFQFRATASYFLCWYTMRRDAILAHFMKGKNCLLFLNRVQESRKSGITIFDWRTDDHNKPFTCAEIMFCPNPCYGKRSEGGIPNAESMLHDPGNPCNEFKDNTCTLNPNYNLDLMGMVRNHLNYTCRCAKGKAAVYNARTGFCQRGTEVETNRQQGHAAAMEKERRNPIPQNNDNNTDMLDISTITWFLLIINILTSVLL